MHVSLKTVLYFCSKEKKASEKKVLNICAYIKTWHILGKHKKKSHFLNLEALLDIGKAT